MAAAIKGMLVTVPALIQDSPPCMAVLPFPIAHQVSNIVSTMETSSLPALAIVNVLAVQTQTVQQVKQYLDRSTPQRDVRVPTVSSRVYALAVVIVEQYAPQTLNVRVPPALHFHFLPLMRPLTREMTSVLVGVSAPPIVVLGSVFVLQAISTASRL